MKIERPIYRVETESLLLRPWREDEVEVLSALILANLEHLRRWFPWANYELEPRDENLFFAGAANSRNQGFRGEFHQSQHAGIVGGIGRSPRRARG